MQTTRNLPLSRLDASVLALISILSAGCDLEPLDPDLGSADAEQTSGAWVSLVRVVESAELGLPRPSGIAFSPGSDLLILGGSPQGASLDGATDLELLTLGEDHAGTIRIGAGTTDPVSMAFDGRANRLLIFQSPGDRLIEVLARPDGSLDPQTLERIDARSFGVRDPQGLTVDPVSGHLFILDAVGPRIVRVEPHARGGFESPTVTEVDLADTGLDMVRGLALDPTDGHIHVFDPAAQALHELTETGRIVATRDLSAFGFRNPNGMVFAPSGDNTDDPSEMSLYVADSGVGATTVLGGGSSFAETGHITELSLAQPR
jgi:hypothetical protein